MMMEKTSTSLRMVYLIDIISFQYATNQNFVVGVNFVAAHIRIDWRIYSELMIITVIMIWTAWSYSMVNDITK